jgi:hypothetical protein
MGTKENPGRFDCHAAALPDEPVFVLLARDPLFEELVETWARRRELAVRCGERPMTDQNKVHEAQEIARRGAQWRRVNNGRWRE